LSPKFSITAYFHEGRFLDLLNHLTVNLELLDDISKNESFLVFQSIKNEPIEYEALNSLLFKMISIQFIPSIDILHFLEKVNTSIKVKLALAIYLHSDGELLNAYNLTLECIQHIENQKYYHHIPIMLEALSKMNIENDYLSDLYKLNRGEKSNLPEINPDTFERIDLKWMNDSDSLEDKKIILKDKLIKNVAMTAKEALEYIVLNHELESELELIYPRMRFLKSVRELLPKKIKALKTTFIEKEAEQRLKKEKKLKSFKARGVVLNEYELLDEEEMMIKEFKMGLHEDEMEKDEVVHLMNLKMYQAALILLEDEIKLEGPSQKRTYLKLELYYALNKHIEFLLLLDDLFEEYDFTKLELLRIKSMEANTFSALGRDNEKQRCMREITRLLNETN
jgi:hypothetical protein